jgi:hypothetical protein
MTTNLNILKEKQENLIDNLEADDLMKYILNLVDGYYKAYFNNDYDSHLNYSKLLVTVIKRKRFSYPNIIQFVYYCLVSFANKQFNKISSIDFELDTIVTSDLKTNDLTEHNILRREFEQALEEQTELASYIWLELTRRHRAATYMIFLDHDDRYNLRVLFENLEELKDDLPDYVLELISSLKESIYNTNPHEKTYHNFSKYQKDIEKEVKDYNSRLDKANERIKELEAELERYRS